MREVINEVSEADRETAIKAVVFANHVLNSAIEKCAALGVEIEVDVLEMPIFGDPIPQRILQVKGKRVY
jgi:hypothetical protein